MKIAHLISQIRQKKSFLCVGLDTDLDKIPQHLQNEDDPIFAFNKAIIDATHSYCVAYKPNIAFYEAYGLEGWKSLERTMDYLNANHPEIFTIADAKRGDIGNTSTRYAKAFFETLNFDSITIAPYMGRDSVEPFLEFEDKHTILLALTSNQGAFDYQTKKVGEQELYKEVLAVSKTYANSDRLMFVVGATKATFLEEIRQIVPESFLLVPGVGAQGGSLQEVCKYGMTKDVGLLVNSSRGILYASQDDDFAEEATRKAKELQREMEVELGKAGFLS
ncbi:MULTISPECIES: orotidine-5'-phosphate decarboxylase [Flavobacteriaceae]|uniref:orotidine-5'-phosphate decarboxylase n=1 Tax=Flavobacteriaceae TaxID=49546 RepID=UPI001490E2C4|nr:MULTISPECIES: orotidine-5'-phosphate decarboxylase [Allomuricauda]MDC6367363.1 orotidine-5'-phosphate decarboxylase [Muricauda sp. AC10]